MTSSSAFRRFTFAYGLAFAVLYVVALKRDLALFTVYPSLGVVLLGTHHSQDITAPSMAFLAPAMYWYGWTATAALGALVFGLAAALLPGTMDAPALVGVGVGRSRTRDDRVRLPHIAVVPAFSWLCEMKNICYPQVTQTPLLTLLLRKPSFGFVRPNSATCILANKDGLFGSFCELARNGNPRFESCRSDQTRRGKRWQLDSNRSEERLEHHPAPLQSARTILHQEVASE